MKTSWLTRKLFGFEGEIALKNLKRNRRKYRATVLSLIISLVLFLTVSYYAEEINRASGTVETGYNFDFKVSYMKVPTAEVREANAKIAALAGVTATVEAERATGVFRAERRQVSELVKRVYTADQESFDIYIQLYCMDDIAFDSYVRGLGADPAEYKDLENPKIILINYGQTYLEGKRLGGEIFSMRPGDGLTLTRGDSDGSGGEGAELQVGMLTEQRPMGVLISSLNDSWAVVSREVFDNLSDGLKNMDSEGNPNLQQLFLNCENDEVLEPRIQELLKDLSERAYVFNVASETRSERNLMLVIGIFIYGFITLISLICIANIFNTVTTNMALRRREFAMLRSVGMTPKSFNRMIYFESLFYGLKALLWGLPISFAVTLLLHYMQSDVFDVGLALPWISYGVAIALIFIIVGSTMLYSSTRIKKENIIDALKTDTM